MAETQENATTDNSNNSKGKVLDAILSINPLKGTTIYGILVLLLLAMVYLLWQQIQQQQAYVRERDEQFMKYVEKRDREMLELMTRINIRLEDQQAMKEGMIMLHTKVDRILERKP